MNQTVLNYLLVIFGLLMLIGAVALFVTMPKANKPAEIN